MNEFFVNLQSEVGVNYSACDSDSNCFQCDSDSNCFQCDSDSSCYVTCDQHTIDLINWNLDQDDYERKRSEEQMGGCNCDCDCDGCFDCPGGGCM